MDFTVHEKLHLPTLRPHHSLDSLQKVREVLTTVANLTFVKAIINWMAETFRQRVVKVHAFNGAFQARDELLYGYSACSPQE